MAMQTFADRQFITGPAELMSVVQSITTITVFYKHRCNVLTTSHLSSVYVDGESQSGANNLP